MIFKCAIPLIKKRLQRPRDHVHPPLEGSPPLDLTEAHLFSRHHVDIHAADHLAVIHHQKIAS